MKFHYSIVLICLLPVLSRAQSILNTKERFRISPALEVLESTHKTIFYAPSIKVNYLYENGLEPGFGVEYSTSYRHVDNNYILTKLHFIPIYGNLKYNVNRNKLLRFYAEASLGYSFNSYNKASETDLKSKTKIKEGGFYLYSGAGTKYAITKDIDVFFAIGFKGYRFTTNYLDVNPHGLSFTLGVTLF